MSITSECAVFTWIKMGLLQQGTYHKQLPTFIVFNRWTSPKQVRSRLQTLLYVQVERRHVYLTAIMDICTHAIQSWQLSHNLDAQFRYPWVKIGSKNKISDDSSFGSRLAICFVTIIYKSVWRVLANPMKTIILNDLFELWKNRKSICPFTEILQMHGNEFPNLSRVFMTERFDTRQQERHIIFEYIEVWYNLLW